jgi:MFS family permease
MVDEFGSSGSEIGLILAGYMLTTLAIRPFSAYMADMFNRKPVYLIAYILFILLFIGYPLAQSILIFALFRAIHGLTFGMVSTAGNTLIVDIMPSSRRGEGLGYFGVANNLAMATGPMLGLMIHESTGSFDLIFFVAVLSGLLGFCFASRIKVPKKNKIVKEPLSLDRFFLAKGLKAGICLMMLAIPYGMLTSYLVMYAQELGLEGNSGLFFLLMAVGLIASRTFAGKLVDKGQITQVITYGIIISIVGFTLFSTLAFYPESLHQFVHFAFFATPVLLGVGYGMLFPAFNTLFVAMAPNNRRATASSTYLTSWDIGIGGGLLLGGCLSGIKSFSFAFIIGTIFVYIAVILFVFVVAPHFEKNKLR